VVHKDGFAGVVLAIVVYCLTHSGPGADIVWTLRQAVPGVVWLRESLGPDSVPPFYPAVTCARGAALELP
jgi:hypothetical protein